MNKRKNNFPCKGAIFDLDGVITQTAKIHFQAWKTMFDAFLAEYGAREQKAFKAFTYAEDYLPYVDGKPRYKGVQSFLDSRDITSLPFGEPGDKPGHYSICALGNLKNQLFHVLIEQGKVEIYSSSVELVKQLRSRGVKTAVASSSANCRYILEKTGLLGLFDTVVGGLLARELDLKGKPHPDIFLAAAGNMKLSPYECLMVEDAISGVQAGKKGNFALVVGVARTNHAGQLKAEGADLVVTDLAELTLDVIEHWFTQGLPEDGWRLVYTGFKPMEERLRESLTTVGNGYFGTRGNLENCRADEVTHYPGTYLAGLYDRLASVIHRKTIYNDDLVNCPNWTLIELKIGSEGEFINPLAQEILHYEHKLELRQALMSRYIIFKDKEGRITELAMERLASMQLHHYGAIRYKIIPHNYREKVIIRSALDGTVINYGVERYRELNSRHLQPVSVFHQDQEMYLVVQTKASGIRIHLQAKNLLYLDSAALDAPRHYLTGPGWIAEELTFDVQQNHTYTLEKLVYIYTSRDRDVDEEDAAEKALPADLTYDKLAEGHINSWQRLWDTADFVITGDRFTQKVVRLHIYHLLVTASPHNEKIDAGMPARGLHGEAYRGHIFWDELFIFPFYNLHFPEITRALLMYRYRRLDAARAYARENGYAGAMYPWQSAETGQEETQEMHFNPRSGKWGPDLSRLQRHVSLAIAYNVWEYYYTTDDLEFLHDYGAEMLLEITRFWASIASYEEEDGRYHINGVMGPDEFHEKYPEPWFGLKVGLKDNAYTNIMASWLIHKTIETISHLPAEVLTHLTHKTGFKTTEMERWLKIVAGMNVAITAEEIIEQFARYKDLAELDLEAYRRKYTDIHRMDRILKAEGDSPNKYKIAKQADMLMSYYLLSPEQVNHILSLMGYVLSEPREVMRRNYEYYIRRTTHGSTLSFIVHASLLRYLKTHRKDMSVWFLKALESDIYDIQGGTTPEGIHCGVMAGTIEIIIKGFAGINLFKDSIRLEPFLPRDWKQLTFKIQHRASLFEFTVTPDTIHIKKLRESVEKIAILIGEERYDPALLTEITVPYAQS